MPVPESNPHYSLLCTLDAVKASPQAALVKTHDLPIAEAHPTIYLLRDGRDALVSYTHLALSVQYGIAPGSATPEQFRSTLRGLILQEQSDYGTWSRNVRAWIARPETVVVRYEDLVRDPGGEVDRALAAVRWPTPRVSDEVPSFDKMKRENATVVRRGIVGSWKDEFPPELLPLFWKQNGDVMRACGYADDEMKTAG